MLDLTSALYLGLRHPSASLGSWNSLTLGKPAALADPPGTRLVAAELAATTGYPRVVLGSSTLHLFWDLFGMLGGAETVIFLDSATYPIARWGAERANLRGSALRRFLHHRPGDLRARISRSLHPGQRPVVVADGYCPLCGRSAPIAEYLDHIRPFDGLLVLDDTQALGIYGSSPSPSAPYGRGGGGSLRRAGVEGQPVAAVSSLAKGFGAPLAMLGGDARLISAFERASETRVHTSPPSVASIRAAVHGLSANRKRGDSLRQFLAERVDRFRKTVGFKNCATPSLFPMQTLKLPAGSDGHSVHSELARRGVSAVLHKERPDRPAKVSLVFRADLSLADIDRAATAVRSTLGRRDRGRPRGAGISIPSNIQGDPHARL